VWDLYEDFRKELQLGLPYNPSALLAEARAKNQAPPIHARAVMDNVPWKDWTREQSMALMPKIVALAKALASGEAQQDGGSAWHSCMCCVKPQMFGYELHEHPHKPTCILGRFLEEIEEYPIHRLRRKYASDVGNANK
jgi:hypothetical protein